MTLHATCLQSFMVWDCSVCELRCLNFKEEGEGEGDEEFWCLWENMHFLFNPFPMHLVTRFIGQW